MDIKTYMDYVELKLHCNEKVVGNKTDGDGGQFFTFSPTQT